MRGAWIAAAFALVALSPATADAARHDALAEVKQLQRGKGVKTGRELTPALNELYAALPTMNAADRREAEAILARPDDTQADPEGSHKWAGPEAPASPVCGLRFCVRWTAVGTDASTKARADELLNILEDEVYACENGVGGTTCGGQPGLGWRDPPGDAGLGGSDHVDAYIQDLFPSGVFGYVALDPGQSSDPAVPHHSYMVLDKDYSRYGGGTAREAAQVTAAHEYNHVLQNGYDFLQDGWMFEATATWAEEKVYPENNGYLRYVGSWVENPRQPLTQFATGNSKVYGSAVWNHWLDRQYGPDVVRDAWAQSVAAANFAPGAFGGQIAARGGGGFGSAFDRFAAAVAEWNVPDIGFPDRYPDMPRDGSLPVGSQTLPFEVPHTTFALFDVPVPANGPRTIRLTGALPQGTQGAVALVGRTGADPNAGTVTTNVTSMPAGGIAAAQLDNPAQFGRITAVVVNSDTSVSGFDAQLDDYVFTKDARDVVVSVIEPGAPVATTGASALVSDHGGFVNASVDPRLNTTEWWIDYGRDVGYGSTTKVEALPASTVGAASVVAPLGPLKGNTIYHYRVRARNSAGDVAGRDMFFRTARDVTPPQVALRVRSQRLARVRARGLRYRARCSERCSGTVELRLSAAVARRTHLPRLLARSRVRLAPGTAFRARRLRLNRRSSHAVRALERGVKATLRLRVADEARNPVTLARRVILPVR